MSSRNAVETPENKSSNYEYQSPGRKQRNNSTKVSERKPPRSPLESVSKRRPSASPHESPEKRESSKSPTKSRGSAYIQQQNYELTLPPRGSDTRKKSVHKYVEEEDQFSMGSRDNNTFGEAPSFAVRNNQQYNLPGFSGADTSGDIRNLSNSGDLSNMTEPEIQVGLPKPQPQPQLLSQSQQILNRRSRKERKKVKEEKTKESYDFSESLGSFGENPQLNHSKTPSEYLLEKSEEAKNNSNQDIKTKERRSRKERLKLSNCPCKKVY